MDSRNFGMTLLTVAVLVALAGCGGEESGGPVGPAPVSALLRDLESDDATVRLRAVRSLADRYPEGVEAVPVLLDALEDDDAAVREEVRLTLASLGSEGVKQLKSFLLGSDPARVNFLRVMEDTFRLGAYRRVNDLVLGWASGPAAPRAGTFVAVLLRSGRLDVEALLADVLLDDMGHEHPKTRAVAAAALALHGWDEVRGERVAPPDPDLMELLDASRQREIRFASARLLEVSAAPHEQVAEGLGLYPYLQLRSPPPPEPDPAELPELLNKIRRLKKIVGDKGRQELSSTARSLSRHGPEAQEAVPDLLRLLDSAVIWHIDSAGIWHGGTVGVALLKIAPAHADVRARMQKELVSGTRRLWYLKTLLEDVEAAKLYVAELTGVLGAEESDDWDRPGKIGELIVRDGSAFGVSRRAKRVALLVLTKLGPAARPALPAIEGLRSHPCSRIRYRAARAERAIGTE